MTQRPLIALEGGPKDRHWYWPEDWNRHLESVRAQFPAGHPDLHYRPANRSIPNSNPKYGHGEVWSYRGWAWTCVRCARRNWTQPGTHCACGAIDGNRLAVAS
jgi:hypothetical protein